MEGIPRVYNGGMGGIPRVGEMYPVGIPGWEMYPGGYTRVGILGEKDHEAHSTTLDMYGTLLPPCICLPVSP